MDGINLILTVGSSAMTFVLYSIGVLFTGFYIGSLK